MSDSRLTKLLKLQEDYNTLHETAAELGIDIKHPAAHILIKNAIFDVRDTEGMYQWTFEINEAAPWDENWQQASGVFNTSLLAKTELEKILDKNHAAKYVLVGDYLSGYYLLRPVIKGATKLARIKRLKEQEAE